MLSLVDVSFGVAESGDAREIVKNINCTLEDDRFIVITGPNGGGKSTLAKLIMGIERPTGGCILHDGVDITGMAIHERARRGIGFAFQMPVRFKGMTVHDLLHLAAGRALSLQEACDYLYEVGLCAQDYIGRALDARLSGGELKRIEIAMVLARKTRLSIFDEPEAGIDLWSFQNLIEVFTRMKAATGGTVVVISHQERILSIADEIIVLADGRIEAAGLRDTVLPGLLRGFGGDRCICEVRDACAGGANP